MVLLTVERIINEVNQARFYDQEFNLFPKELELSTEQLEKRDEKKSSRLAYTQRDTGEIISTNVDQIADIEDIVPTGTWEAPQKDMDDVENEVILILDIMAMAPGKYGNRWFLGLCADPDADLEDESAFFTLPFGGKVVVEKLAKIGGYRQNNDGEWIKNPDGLWRFPVKTLVIKVDTPDPKKNPYHDLVSPNWVKPTPKKK